MAYTSVTYSFSNSTTSDATQVNQNFTDIINGISDGTKDINVNALTAAGAAALNGSVSLGNGSPDDISWLGSLATSVPVKTTFSYDLGSSTIGWKSFYLGSDDSAAKTVRVIAGTVGTSYTLTLPTGAGSAGYGVSNLGSGALAFLPQAPDAIVNLGLAASVGSSALTINLKGADGNAPSATNPVYITFRNSTSATGTPVVRAVTSALSTVISSGSTAGFTSGAIHYLNWYAIDNAGTVELAWSGTLFDRGTVVSTTAEGGAGAADSGYVMYSTTARSNVACVPIGRTKHSLTTAGTWNENPDEVSLTPCYKKGFTSQIQVSQGNGHGSTGTKIRRWSVVTTNLGSDMTLTQDATNGDYITINVDGDYFFGYSDYRSAAGCGYGISLNASSNTAALASLAASEILASLNDVTGSLSPTVTWSGRLKVGDIIRAHTDGTPNSTDGYSRFYASRLLGS